MKNIDFSKYAEWLLPGSIFFMLFGFCSSHNSNAVEFKIQAQLKAQNAIEKRIEQLKSKADSLFCASDKLMMRARKYHSKNAKKIIIVNPSNLKCDSIQDLDKTFQHEYYKNKSGKSDRNFR